MRARSALFGMAILGATIAVAPSNAGNPCTPTQYEQPPGDNTRDAAGFGQLFERVHAPGLTDRSVATASAAFADANHDGLVDVYLMNNGQGFGLFLNKGCLGFEQHALTIHRLASEGQNFDSGGIVVALADFNDDGYPDFYLGTSGGNRSQLLLSQGAFDVFEDYAFRLGVDNTGAYVHGQISIADVNQDGWLDIAVGAEQIANDTALGRPLSRVYIYRPASGGEFTAGRFEDIGGTELIPDFGGVDLQRCDAEHDRAVSAIALRDLDDDGDLDLIQGSQSDMNPLRTTDPGDACAPGTWRFGIFAWENLLQDTGEFRFRKIAPGTGNALDDTDAILPEEGRMVYNYALQRYDPVERAMSAYVVQTADVDNDDDLDVIAAVSTDPEWNAQSDWVGGKSWRNDGAWSFHAATEEQGLESLRWTYRRWIELFDAESESSAIAASFCAASSQRSRCATMALEDHTFMTADLVAADWDNDGWQDLMYADRHEIDRNFDVLRDAFIRNDGDGTFTAMPTTWSGISENMIAGEAVDLDGDGRLDYFQMARNSGSGQLPVVQKYVVPDMPADQDNNRVFWNAGEHGAAGNHWIRVILTGLPQRKLLGARIMATAPDGNSLGRRDYVTTSSYKTTHEPYAHFGLGVHDAVSIRIVLPGGGTGCTNVPTVNRVLVVDVSSVPTC